MADKSGWFDKPANLKLFLRIFYVSLVILLVIDFFISKHAAFGFDGVTNFFAVYGFISCVMLVLIAKVMRMFLMKDEEYYDD